MAIITFLVSAIKFGMVLLFGSTGETLTEKSGHLNLGLPGVMCVGTACGCIAEAMLFDIVGGRRGMEKISFLAVLIPILATLIGGALMTSPDYSGELLWGETPACEKRSGTLFAGGYWHSASLTDLIPNKKYYFKIDSRSPLREHHSNLELAVRNRNAKRVSAQTGLLDFTTLKKAEPSRVLRVEKSISETLEKARYGDTVLIPGGVYSETLRVPVSGITIRNVPGEKVWLDGKTLISSGVILENKENVTIDGLFFRHYPGFAVVIRGGKNININRCFYDGRSSNYTNGMITANCVEKLTFSNSFITNGFYGSSFWRCKDLMIRNNVWYCNQINNFSVHNQPYEIATVKNNIFFDLVPMIFPSDDGVVYSSLLYRICLGKSRQKDKFSAFCH